MAEQKVMQNISLVDIFYPVGSYYETSDENFDPNVRWGGTWYLEVAGQVHVSGGSNYIIDSNYTDLDNGDGTVGASQGGRKDAIIPYHHHTASGGKVTDKAAFNTNNSGAVTNGITGGSHDHQMYGWWSTGSGSDGAAYITTSNRARERKVTGDRTHTHNLPNHVHSIPAHGHGFTQPTISYEGESVTDKNMQPYIVVNRWHRVA